MEHQELMKRLQEPFLPEEIEWRVDRGQITGSGNYVFVLAYVTNRAIMNRLDEIFGPTGWRNEFKEWKQGSQLCGISVKMDGEWITKWDGSDDSNMDAVKGGLSAAMKRAAVQWGIGRYLYKLDQNRIPLKEHGDNYANVRVKAQGKDEYIKGYWDVPTLPSWALPAGYQTPKNSRPQNQLQEEPPAQGSPKQESPKQEQPKQNAPSTPKPKMISDGQVKYSQKLKTDKRISDDDFKMMIRQSGSGKESLKELTMKEAIALINQLNEYPIGA